MRAALLVGAGAVENGWAPVIRALQGYCYVPLSAKGANFYMARLIYKLRFYIYKLRSYGTLDIDLARQEAAMLKDHLANIRKAICTELSAAQSSGEIKIRKEFDHVIEKLLLPDCNEFLMVSTNWDLVADKAITQVPKIRGASSKWNIRTLHIHGSIKKHNTLYLPSEVIREPYREKGEEEEIGNLHSSIMLGLEVAHRIVLYGLSISPLDAELSQLLLVGWDNPNLREILIVDPDHESIAERVMLLLRPREISVRGYHPSDLASGTEYAG